jgi:nitroreductase/dihydropteridine reductase
MTHPIINDLQARHTVKGYDPTKKVSADDIATLCEAIRLSPSSINSQPWRFIVIQSDEAKQRFSDSFANMYQFNQAHATNASHIILFAHDPYYTREKYAKVVDQQIADGRLKPESRESGFGGYVFAETNTDDSGYNGAWTKAQTYLALGNAMHSVARLGIESTPMEGVDTGLIGEIFSEELDGFVCEVALAIGYHDEEKDYNALLPKSRLAMKDVLSII